MSSKSARKSATPSWPQTDPCPGTKTVSLSHEANVFKVCLQPDTVDCASKQTGYNPENSRSPVYTTFCSGTRTTMSVPECPGELSITAVNPPKSIFIGNFAGSIG